MFNLTFDDIENSPNMAYVEGGEYDKEILFLNNDSDHKNKKKINTDDINILIENLFRTMNGKISFKTLDQLRDAIINKKEPTNRELKQHYKQALKMLNKNKNKEIILNSGNFVPMFDETKERMVFMIAGMSGSGKSYYTAELCKTYHLQYPDNKIILFSNKPEDPVFDDLNYVERILIDDDLLNDQLTLNELNQSLVIFDDVEYSTNKLIDSELNRIRDLILQQGRSYNISFIYISHQANNYKQTRTILNECHSITIFPQMCTRYGLKYLLDKYFGFNKNEINKICSLPSRWVTIYKSPPFILYQNGAYLIN